MFLAFNIVVLAFLGFFMFWLVSMIISSLTRAPYVPTAGNAYQKALELAEPKAGEKLFDLGCGDGRILRFAATKYGVVGIGYEISPYCILVNYFKNRSGKFRDNVKVYKKPLQEADFGQADIIFLYLTNSILDAVEQNLFAKIKPSCRVVTVAFKFEHHRPVKKVEVAQLGRKTFAYLYEKTS